MDTAPIKNEILVRVYIVLFLLIAGAVVIFSSAVRISVFEGDKLRSDGQSDVIKEVRVEAERGNIYTETGALLATSIPVYDLSFDPNSDAMQEQDFLANIDSLAVLLSQYVDTTLTPGAYRDFLIDRRRKGRRHVFIKKGVSYAEKERIRQFPLFNKGQFRGGFIVKKRFRRERPFNLLANRTIGYKRSNAQSVGLEAAFDEQLRGDSITQTMMRVDFADRGDDIFIPIEEFDNIEPKRGDDIVTTIDIEMQRVTENALLRAMNYHNAEWGTAVVMEVKTGKIKAIANLGKTSRGGWWETYNFAVGQLIEPGSTFKLASIMALLEDDYVDLDDSIELFQGRVQFYDRELEDSYAHNMEKSTVQRAFEISSNVGLSTMVNYYYDQRKNADGKVIRNADGFIKRLKQFNLNLPTGIEIEGERLPYIKEAYNVDEDQWSGTTLPWMSIGYEAMFTPLQLLTFFNAVANDGVMMRPYLVTEIQHLGQVVETFKPTMIAEPIASRKTIRDAKILLEGVVENGTARKLKTDQYRFAGKTGTAQFNYQRLKSRTNIEGYQASFAGYFPAEAPLYSCIVVINKPRQNGIYGGDVAGPVFREIADNAYASKMNLHQAVNIRPTDKRSAPAISSGKQQDMAVLLEELELPNYGKPGTDWVVLKAMNRDTLKVLTRRVPTFEVPNVIGMGLRDALYLLENRQLEVKARGVGVVTKQSLDPGTRVSKGGTIWLLLE